jgi:hypothetical protein
LKTIILSFSGCSGRPSFKLLGLNWATLIERASRLIPESVHYYQGDQIGRFFACKVIVHFVRGFLMTEVCVVNFWAIFHCGCVKTGIGLQFGRFFANSSGHPDYYTECENLHAKVLRCIPQKLTFKSRFQPRSSVPVVDLMTFMLATSPGWNFCSDELYVHMLIKIGIESFLTLIKTPYLYD